MCNIHGRHQMFFLMLLLNRHSNDFDTRHKSSLMIESVLATQPEMNGHSYGCSAVSVHCRSDDRQLQARWCQLYFVRACNASRSSESVCRRCLRASTKTFVKINVIHMDPVSIISTTNLDEDHCSWLSHVINEMSYPIKAKKESRCPRMAYDILASIR